MRDKNRSKTIVMKLPFVSNKLLHNKISLLSKKANFLSRNKKNKDDVDIEWDCYFQSYNNVFTNSQWYKSCETCEENIATDYHNLIFQAATKSVIKNPTVMYIVCIDEGVQDLFVGSHDMTLCVAGSGITGDSDNQLSERIIELAQQYNISKIVVTSHSDCGATRSILDAQIIRTKKLRSSLFSKMVDLSSQEYGELLQKEIHTVLQNDELCNATIQVKTKFISKLDRPHFHHAFGVIVNYIPVLNIGKVEEYLGYPLFGLSGYLLSMNQLKHQIEIAYYIATSDSGFRNHFTEENPFEVICIVKDEEEKNHFLSAISTLSADMCIKYSITFLVV